MTFFVYRNKLRLDETTEQFKNMNEIAHVFLDQGRYMLKKEDYIKSLKELFVAGNIWENQGYKKGLCDVYTMIGICYEKLRDYKNALNSYLVAYDNNILIGSPIISKIVSDALYRLEEIVGSKLFQEFCRKLDDELIEKLYSI